MIEQTYYPFGGEFSTSPTLSGHTQLMNQGDYKKNSNWFAYVLIIVTLIGFTSLVYWWRSKFLDL